MKKVAEIQFYPWGQIYDFEFPEGLKSDNFKVGDQVVVKTEQGIESGKIIGFREIEIKSLKIPLKPILRRANAEDWTVINEHGQREIEARKIWHELIKRHRLKMKLAGIYFSYDDGKVTFAFSAEGRVDFRSFVRDLTHHFQKSVRLQQLGPRDEAKILGDLGACGRQLCCRKFLKNLSSITTEMAQSQQVFHRGAERLSGCCGRLMCCLKYEEDLYQELTKKIPELDTVIKTKKGKGKVISRHILKGSVRVKLDSGDIVEVQVKK